ncbi:hypothetical protein D3C76_1662520 [compost metagenome]
MSLRADIGPTLIFLLRLLRSIPASISRRSVTGDLPITKYCLSLAITFGNFSIACCTVNSHTLVSCTAPFITDDNSGSAATSSSIATMPSQGSSFAQRVTS